MMRKKPPCKKNGLDCPRRTLTCHGVCKEFKEWKAELDAQNLEKQKENDRYSNPDRPRRYKNIIERIKQEGKLMADREKVIKGLEGMIDYFFDIYRNDTDSYKCAKAQEYSDCAIDAIKLLKEQEPVEPEVEVLNEIDRLYKCPKCHKHFFYKKQKYCDQCGQAVKWECKEDQEDG